MAALFLFFGRVSVCAVELNREPQKSYGANFSAEIEAIAPDKSYLWADFSLTSVG
jgi:hypothetical protein